MFFDHAQPKFVQKFQILFFFGSLVAFFASNRRSACIHMTTMYGADARRRALLPHCKVDDVQQNIRLLVYYRKGAALKQQAELYMALENWDTAYVMYKRLAT